MREKVDVPIVAAGGIVDGRGMAAAFALGAEGVTMGTRFVASFESPVHPNYKQAIVAAPITGTSLTDNPPRARSRGLRTPYADRGREGKRERLPRNATLDMLYVNGDVDNTSGAAGESAGLIHEIKSVRQIVDDTIEGFWREIDRLARLRPSTLSFPTPSHGGGTSSLESRELQAERAQPAARLGVVGLRVGARFVQHVEVEAAPALEPGRDGELQDRLGAVLDLAHRRDAGLAHHGRVHVGRGMQRVGDHARSLELVGEIDGEHDLRQLALAVGGDAAVAAWSA